MVEEEYNNEAAYVGVEEEEYDPYASSFPQQQIKDNMFKFFRDLLRARDNRKTGYLADNEAGILRLPARSYIEVARYNYAENQELVGDYLNNKAEILLTTGLSRKGFQQQLFVTQIKKTSSISTIGSRDNKTGLFTRKQKDNTEGE